EYKIKLSRPDKEGDEYKAHVTATVKQKLDMTANGQQVPAKDDKFTAELTGTVKVLAVNKIGQASKLTVTVEKLTKDGNEFYAPGTVITAEKVAGKPTFSVDNNNVDPEKAEVLDSVIEVSADDKSTNDDELSGTDQPQKVGASWPINSEKVAK